MTSAEALTHLVTIGTAAGALSATFGAFWFVIRPLYKWLRSFGTLVYKVDSALPIWLSVANEFKPNGGNSLRDVIDRIEHEVHFTRQGNRVFMDSLPNGFYEADSKGKRRWLSHKWCEITGMVPNDAEGDGWYSSVHPDDRVAVRMNWESAVAESRKFELVYRIMDAEGKARRVKCQASPLKNPSGKLIGFLGSLSLLDDATGVAI